MTVNLNPLTRRSQRASKPRVLIVAHELTLTGSPMNLLHLLRWLVEKRANEVDLEVLALAGGALESRFRNLAPVTVLDPGPATSALGALQGGLQHLGSSRAWRPVAAARLRPQLRRLGRPDLVYCNSLPAVSVVPYLQGHGPVVAHAHELQVAYRLMRPYDQQVYRSVPDHYIAASDAVRQMLVDTVELSETSISTHHEFIDARALVDYRVDLREQETIRRSLKLPVDAAIVVGAGTVEWRKGADLFIQLAGEVRRRRAEPVHFIWVGGDLTGADWHRVRSDMDRSSADHVHFVGVKPDPRPWFSVGDVFALCSREDPYPLVALETAALGKPIVTYRNGGLPELLEAAGPEAFTGVVDHLDVGALADATIAMLDDDVRSRAAGKSLQECVLAHHDVTVAAPALWAELRQLMDDDS